MPLILQGVEALSERQKEVLRLTAQHLQAKEIARALNITERTVRAHTESARHRLGVATSREAVRIFLASESAAAPVKNGQWPSTPISDLSSEASLLVHEQALSTAQRTHDDQLHTPGDGMADAGNAQQTQAYPGRDRYVEEIESGPRSRESNLQYDRRERMADGRWSEFRRRLKDLSAITLLGLIVIAAIALALIAGMFAGTLLGIVEVVHKLTIYAGWES